MKTSRAPLFLFSSVAVTLALGVAGCGSDDPAEASSTGGDATTSTTSAGSGGSGGDSTTSGAGGAGGEVIPEPLERRTISGDATWAVTFDAEAQALGATDCSYTRHYEGVEDMSALWLCPECEIMFFADVTMTAGLDDCFSQVSGGPPNPTEWVGYGGGTWWRGGGATMTDQGVATTSPTEVSVTHQVLDNPLTAGGTLSFDITGQFALGDEEGDPMNGFNPPDTYACGWPKADPPEYTGDYLLTKGATIPDGLFLDACGEAVRLHDLKGAYLLVEMSAMDCPPCQAMAGAEEQFVADMEAQGITVFVVTLLAPSLSNVLGTTTKTMLDTWISKYDLTSPVLADRGWGLTMFDGALGPENVGYPSWTLVDPDLKVLDYNSGFGSFDEFEAAILADAQ